VNCDGRRAGLKIQSPQGGVGSSPTFGNRDRIVNGIGKVKM
jgi:hypothetical protein